MTISNPPGRPRKPWDLKRTSISVTLPVRVLRALDQLSENRSGFVAELVENDPRVVELVKKSMQTEQASAEE